MDLAARGRSFVKACVTQTGAVLTDHRLGNRLIRKGGAM